MILKRGELLHMTFTNLWDTGLFEPERDIVVDGSHFYLDSAIAYERDMRELECRQHNYNNRENYTSEINRYMQENVYDER